MAGNYPLEDAEIISLVEHDSFDESYPREIEEYGDVILHPTMSTLDLGDLQKKKGCDLQKKKNIERYLPKTESENQKASVCDEENEEDQLLDANEAFSADSDLEEPESAEDFCTAEQPQQFKTFSQMNELIKAVKDGHINTGAILKDPRSTLGFEFHHYFMIKNKDTENFKVINLEKGCSHIVTRFEICERS